MFEGKRGCGSEGDVSSTVHPLSRHAYSDVLNVESLPMGLGHVVLQGGEEKRSGEEEGMGGKVWSGVGKRRGWEERCGVEWGRGGDGVGKRYGKTNGVPGPSNDHTSRIPMICGSNFMAFDKGNKRGRGTKSCGCTQILKY